MPKKPPYVDLSHLSEHERIIEICNKLRKGLKVGFLVDNHSRKIERYEKAISDALPGVTIKRLGVIVPGTMAMKAWM